MRPVAYAPVRRSLERHPSKPRHPHTGPLGPVRAVRECISPGRMVLCVHRVWRILLAPHFVLRVCMLPVAPQAGGSPDTGRYVDWMLGGYGVNSDGGARMLGVLGSARHSNPYRSCAPLLLAGSRLAAESAQDEEMQSCATPLPARAPTPARAGLPATCRNPCGYAVSVHPMWDPHSRVTIRRPVLESVPCTCRNRCGSRPRTGPWRSLGFGPNAARAQRPPRRLRRPRAALPFGPPYPVAFGLRFASPSSSGPLSLLLRAGPTPEHCPWS